MTPQQRADAVDGSIVRDSEEQGLRVITAAEMDKTTPQERADVVDAGIVRSWEDVPEPFRSEVLFAARQLGEQRRARA